MDDENMPLTMPIFFFKEMVSMVLGLESYDFCFQVDVTLTSVLWVGDWDR